ncbi:MAG: hypothetical protein ABSE73_01935 [Planctomycetota bacterium]
MSMISGLCKTRCVADALGLGTLADGDEAVDPENLRALYRHARGEDGKRVLYANDLTFKRGWVNLDAPKARELISAFVPLEDADDLKAARRMAQANLEAQPWNDVLGINSPPIQCRVKIHGSKWALRFQSAEPALRGQELVNEELPPIPVAPSTTPSVAPVSVPMPQPQPEQPTSAIVPATPTTLITLPDAAADMLRRGGLPV